MAVNNANAILVSASFHALNTNLTDRVQQSNIETQTGAKRGKVTVKKQILSEWSALKRRKTIKQNAYTDHINMTSPTFREAERVLNSIKAMDYGDVMKKAKADLDVNAQEIRDTYDQAVEHDKQNVLRGLADGVKYPTVDEIIDAFHIEHYFLPFPKNFEVPVPLEEVEKTEAKLKELEEIVNKDILTQVKELTSGFVSALKEAQRFHADSWVEKISDLTERVGYLNVYDNELIKQVNESLHNLVAEIRPEELRVSPEAKQDLAKDLEAFINDYKGMF